MRSSAVLQRAAAGCLRTIQNSARNALHEHDLSRNGPLPRSDVCRSAWDLSNISQQLVVSNQFQNGNGGLQERLYQQNRCSRAKPLNASRRLRSEHSHTALHHFSASARCQQGERPAGGGSQQQHSQPFNQPIGQEGHGRTGPRMPLRQSGASHNPGPPRPHPSEQPRSGPNFGPGACVFSMRFS